MSRALKPDDVLELSKLYEAEFNKPDMHDRVLIFDVVASWPRRLENEGIKNEASSRSEDGSDGETAEIENVENSVNTSDENETESHDCEIASNGNQQIELKLSNESKDDHIGTGLIDNGGASIEMQDANETEGTKEHETVLNENVEINQNTSNGNEMKDKHESEITNDDNDVTPSLNDKSENSNEISSKNNEAMSYPTNEREIIRQHKFYIHSSWLAVQSSYFCSLFFSGMKESNTTEVHVQISESEEQAQLMLLEAMYKIDILDNSSVDELLEVLRLAHKYDVKFVFKKAKYCLQAAVVSLDICEKIMCFIKVDNAITDVEDLASTLQSFLAKEFSPLDKTWQTTSFRKLCEPSLRYLLSSEELVAASENTVFHSLMYWIEQHGIENVSENDGMPSLLSIVRFELMPIDYLYNIVQHDAVAKKLPDFNDHYLRGISYHAVSDSMKQRLLCQPVKRKASTESFIPYTWVIPKEDLDKLVGTDKSLKSDQFWYCGYRMVLVITKVVNITNFGGNQAMFTATVGLGIDNITQQSEVMIQWRPTSQFFTSTPPERKHTFDGKPYMSSVEIRYKMEVQQKTPSGSTVIAPTFGGFSQLQPTPCFGSSVIMSETITLATSGLTFCTPSSKPNSGFMFGAGKPTSSPFSSIASPSTNTLGGKPAFGAKPAFEGNIPTFKGTPTFGAKLAFKGISTFEGTPTLEDQPGLVIIKQKSLIPCLSIDVKIKLV
ncbi:BTB POZ domain-containing POB1 [Paramuricea clavata]|uniref:BTB POZ domain-containing POB1 n=1 Tax=Paramuricea clavata TaxID=317549 RepID=A0A6S7JDF8_PARCT|nr:BTB POZ domain-containing POB1 [Paramuricea clavata]